MKKLNIHNTYIALFLLKQLDLVAALVDMFIPRLSLIQE